MATTPAELCSIALGYVGIRVQLDRLDEPGLEAEACAKLWPHCRDLLLSRRHWTFAARRAQLTAVVGAERSGWGYAYRLPSDFLAVRSLHNELNYGILETVAGRTRYRVEGSPSGSLLFTNTSAVELLYTARFDTVVLYPPLVQDALAWLLASRLALELPVKPQLAAAALQQYERALAEAAALDAAQAQEGPPGESEFIRVRG